MAIYCQQAGYAFIGGRKEDSFNSKEKLVF